MQLQADTAALRSRIRELKEYVRNKPDDLEALIELGGLCHVNREFESATRCYRDALNIQEDARCWNELGRSLNNMRDLEGAEEAFSKAGALDPGSAEMQNNLGHVRRARKDYDGAECAFRAAIAADPGFARAHHNLATVFNNTGRFDDAIESFGAGLRCNPDDPQALTNLGDMFHVCQRYDEAEECYRKALECDPVYVDAWTALGWLYQGRRRIDEAQQAFEEVLRIMPEHSVALSGITALAELKGDYETGQALLEPLIDSGRVTPEIQVAYARLLHRMRRSDEALQLVESVVEQASDKDTVPPAIHFSLGDLHDAAGNYDAAFESYRRANELVAGNFDPDDHHHGINALIEFYDRETLGGLPHSSVQRQTPVFIVGMPRSGTSLVEQILASHPLVHAAGERVELYHMARNMREYLNSAYDQPGCLVTITPPQLDGLAKQYFDALGDLDSDISCVTDKLPANFLLIGLMELVFPDARVIHCQRDPLDSGLSCYFQNFNSKGLAFSRDLGHIGAYYNEYMRLMAHWHEVSSLPILDLPYAELVGDVETWSQRLVEFAGLPWNHCCLKFYNIDRIVNTGSYAQVRKPIYSTSVNRYRHYESHLQPLKDALAAGTS